MNRYRISVEVKIEACEGTVDANPVEQSEGSFRLVISDEMARSIDDCEQALLRTNYAAVGVSALWKAGDDVGRLSEESVGSYCLIFLQDHCCILSISLRLQLFQLDRRQRNII